MHIHIHIHIHVNASTNTNAANSLESGVKLLGVHMLAYHHPRSDDSKCECECTYYVNARIANARIMYGCVHANEQEYIHGRAQRLVNIRICACKHTNM